MNSNKPTGNSDSSAILFLDDNKPIGPGSFQPSSSSSSSSSRPQMDGHQILDQVQLQFLSTGNENAFVTGQIHYPQQQQNPFKSTSSYNVEPSIILTGTMDQPNRDTEFLISEQDDTQPIDLGSPVHHHGSPSFGGVGGGNDQSKSKSNLTIWQFDYYARYFDLTTETFFQRILWSLLPLTGGEKGTYIDRFISSNVDLYGPFWIPLTLAFTIAICDDIISFMNLNSSSSSSVPSIHSNTSSSNSSSVAPSSVPSTTHIYHPLKFDLDRLNMATTITFSYIIFIPIILWSFCQWRQCKKLYSFLQCICLYGYSLSIFIPITILSLINLKQIQFILFASAAFLSGSVLLITFAPVVHSDPSSSFKFAYIILIFILLAHLTLALFYLYMFL